MAFAARVVAPAPREKLRMELAHLHWRRSHLAKNELGCNRLCRTIASTCLIRRRDVSDVATPLLGQVANRAVQCVPTTPQRCKLGVDRLNKIGRPMCQLALESSESLEVTLHGANLERPSDDTTSG